MVDILQLFRAVLNLTFILLLYMSSFHRNHFKYSPEKNVLKSTLVNFCWLHITGQILMFIFLDPKFFIDNLLIKEDNSGASLVAQKVKNSPVIQET